MNKFIRYATFTNGTVTDNLVTREVVLDKNFIPRPIFRYFYNSKSLLNRTSQIGYNGDIVVKVSFSVSNRNGKRNIEKISSNIRLISVNSSSFSNNKISAIAIEDDSEKDLLYELIEKNAPDYVFDYLMIERESLRKPKLSVSPSVALDTPSILNIPNYELGRGMIEQKQFLFVSDAIAGTPVEYNYYIATMAWYSRKNLVIPQEHFLLPSTDRKGNYKLNWRNITGNLYGTLDLVEDYEINYVLYYEDGTVRLLRDKSEESNHDAKLVRAIKLHLEPFKHDCNNPFGLIVEIFDAKSETKYKRPCVGKSGIED